MRRTNHEVRVTKFIENGTKSDYSWDQKIVPKKQITSTRGTKN
jgi:hypothetical protein